MDFEIKTGTDGREYAVFDNQFELDQYCDENSIDVKHHSVGGRCNAILLDDVVTA